jgi:hypothetical protein
VFHERDDNLAFCPILHVLALAFADGAFRSEFIRTPDDLYNFSVDAERGIRAVPIEWKPEVMELPLFRRAIRSANGYETSSKAWTCADAMPHTKSLGRAVGFKHPLRLYAARRGAGEAIDGENSLR